MSPIYVLQRAAIFVVVVWAAATLIFILPHLAPGRNPVRERLIAMAAAGAGRSEGIEAVVAAFERDFGLDKPLWQQYINFLKNTARLDFGTSLALFPTKVWDLILQSLPWTIGLLGVATVIAFVVGTLAGALLAWQGAPRFLQFLFPPFMVFSAVPYFLLGLMLIYAFAFTYRIFPIAGGSDYNTISGWNLNFVRDVIYHSILPGTSIVLAGVGFWALGMRAMMVSVNGEDYIALAEARGLKSWRIFFQYAMRNAILPQITGFALALGFVVSGLVLVEVIFGYPGIGSLLFKAVSSFDYFTIYGVVFMIIVGIGLTTFIIDIMYPILDPRIRYRRG